MGILAHFDVGSLIARYGLLHFVETGTGRGEGLAHAARFGFRTLRSCETMPVLAHAAVDMFFADDRVVVEAGDSVAFLRAVCAQIPLDEPVLFWLDAHFPGADYGLASYGDEVDVRRRLPLSAELATIAAERSWGRDVVLCDDLRVFVDGPFGHGNLPAAVRPFCPPERDAGFFARVLGTTHDVRFDFADEGYVAIVPEEKPHG